MAKSKFTKALGPDAVLKQILAEELDLKGKSLIQAAKLTGRDPELLVEDGDTLSDEHRNRAKSNMKNCWEKVEEMLAAMLYGVATGKVKLPDNDYWRSYETEPGKVSFFGQECEVEYERMTLAKFSRSVEKILQQDAIKKMLSKFSPSVGKRGKGSGLRADNKAEKVSEAVNAILMDGIDGVEII